MNKPAPGWPELRLDELKSSVNTAAPTTVTVTPTLVRETYIPPKSAHVQQVWERMEAELDCLDPSQENDYIFRDIVGQHQAKERLCRLAHKSLQRADRECTTNILFDGPSSVGKTTLARTFVKGIQLPLVEINGAKVRTVDEILAAIKSALEEQDRQWRAFHTEIAEFGYDETAAAESRECLKDPNGMKLVEFPGQKYFLPPLMIFVDEAHRLSRPLQERLLKAVEPKDRVMETENGDTINCSRIGWIFATTHPSMLIEALHNRFRRIKLKLYSRIEIAQIVRRAFGLHSDLCVAISRYSPHVPREALDFVREVEEEQQQHPEQSWATCIERVATNLGIDNRGLTQERRDILVALGQNGPMSMSRLAAVAQVDEDTCRDRVLPPLLAGTPDEPALVAVAHKHYITVAGLYELDRRGISHISNQALPKDMR